MLLLGAEDIAHPGLACAAARTRQMDGAALMVWNQILIRTPGTRGGEGDVFFLRYPFRWTGVNCLRRIRHLADTCGRRFQFRAFVSPLWRGRQTEAQSAEIAPLISGWTLIEFRPLSNELKACINGYHSRSVH